MIYIYIYVCVCVCVCVACRLDFRSTMESKEVGSFVSNADTSDEEIMFKFVYESVLEAIISNQTAKISSPESDSDGFKTPTSAPRLKGVAETCPGAPLKPTRKL